MEWTKVSILDYSLGRTKDVPLQEEIRWFNTEAQMSILWKKGRYHLAIPSILPGVSLRMGTPAGIEFAIGVWAWCPQVTPPCCFCLERTSPDSKATRCLLLSFSVHSTAGYSLASRLCSLSRDTSFIMASWRIRSSKLWPEQEKLFPLLSSWRSNQAEGWVSSWLTS